MIDQEWPVTITGIRSKGESEVVGGSTFYFQSHQIVENVFVTGLTQGNAVRFLITASF